MKKYFFASYVHPDFSPHSKMNWAFGNLTFAWKTKDMSFPSLQMMRQMIFDQQTNVFKQGLSSPDSIVLLNWKEITQDEFRCLNFKP